MSNYKKFNPYEIANSKEVNNNFKLVVNDITNSTASGIISEAIIKGDIKFNNNSIIGLPESNFEDTPTILQQLPNRIAYLNNNLRTFDLGNNKTLIITVNQTDITNITIEIVNNKPLYTYTFITSGNVNTDVQIKINSGTTIYTIPPNSTLSVFYYNGIFLKYNNSFNFNIIKKPLIKKKLKIFKSNALNTIAPIPLPEGVALADIVSLTLNILSINFTRDNTMEYSIKFSNNADNNNNSSYSTISFSTILRDDTPAPISNININSNRNLLGNINTMYATTDVVPIVSSYYFSFNHELEIINYTGYGVNSMVSANAAYNTYGGTFKINTQLTTNLLTFSLISFTKYQQSTLSYYNYVINSSKTNVNVSSINYNYSIEYKSDGTT